MQLNNSNNEPSPPGTTDFQSLQFAMRAAGVGMWDVQLVEPWTVVWDDRCKELFGLSKEGVITFADVLQNIHPDDREAVDISVRNALDATSGGHCDNTYRTINDKDGKVLWVHSIGNAFFDDAGVPYRFSGITMDISEKIIANQKAAVAEQLANVAIKGSGIGLFHVDSNNNIEYSPAFAAILTGEANTNLTRADFLKHIHPDDAGIRADAFEKQAATGDLYYEARTIWKDGSIRWIRTVGTSSFDESSNQFTFSGTVQDITEQKEKELALNIAKDQFRNIFEQAPVAIGLLKGLNMVVEQANDTLLKLWGRDDKVIGLPLAEALPEIKDQPFLGLLEDVFKTGKPYYGYGAVAKLNRSVELQNFYFDFVYTPIRDAGGRVTDIMLLATEVTPQVLARKALEESELRFRSLVERATVATCLFVGREMKIEVANDMMIKVFGKDRSIIGKPLVEAVPELRGQSFLKILDDVFTTGEDYSADNSPANLEVNGVLSTFYFDFSYKALRNAEGDIYGIMETAIDVTEQVLARRKVEESELFTRSIIYNSPVAKMVFIGDDMTINIVNENMLNILGRDIDAVLGKPLMEVCPELIPTPILDRLKHVLATGETYYQPEEMLIVMRYGKPHLGYYNYIYKVLVNTAGENYGVMCTATEVTDQVTARLELEASKDRLRSLVESAPFPIGVYIGREMKIELANQAILDVWGKGDDVIGKRYSEILPELQNQNIFQQLDDVYSSGISFSSRNQRVDIENDGELKSYYFNYDFTPLFDANGIVYGVMNTAADITDLVFAKQQIEQAEASLRGAIELAELGTWNLDIKTNMLYYSERLNSWFGFRNNRLHTLEEGLNPIKKTDQPTFHQAFQQALAPGSDGIFDVEYTVINPKTARERILHAQGKTLFNANGDPYKIAGTAQDVTAQRKLQLALEQEVQERTEELQTVNEELTATNEELHESNIQLQHSNEELAQYAYVASHDLQEPLRKIRMFSDMLGKKPDLPKDHFPLVEKISQSSERMTLLIRDLLEFSRLLKTDVGMRPIKLSEIIRSVVDDFELTINEKEATIDIGELPVVEAVSLQMNQLFYNLLSNALKFTKPGTSPIIKVRNESISFEEAKKYIPKASALSNYYRISFADNGIGFEPSYSEQIFEVFKRLHGKDIYPGSGIGLALCRRIVTNHNGYLYTQSVPKQGTTFYIILPDMQHT